MLLVRTRLPGALVVAFCRQAPAAGLFFARHRLQQVGPVLERAQGHPECLFDGMAVAVEERLLAEGVADVAAVARLLVFVMVIVGFYGVLPLASLPVIWQPAVSTTARVTLAFQFVAAALIAAVGALAWRKPAKSMRTLRALEFCAFFIGAGYLAVRFAEPSWLVLAGLAAPFVMVGRPEGPLLVVTADGQFLRASEQDNPDLFWGLRGGGGNFGVVTGIDYGLHPVGPEVLGGLVAWPADEAPKVLELYRTLSEEAPPELTLVTLLRPAPPAPWLPKDVHGKPIIAILACYSGNPEEGEKLVAPIKSFGKPIGDVLVRRPYVQMQSLLDATQPTGRRYYWKSEYLPRIDPALCEKVMEHAARIRSPHSAVILFQIGGALNRLEDGHLAVSAVGD